MHVFILNNKTTYIYLIRFEMFDFFLKKSPIV